MSQHNIVPRLAISAALGGLLYGYDTAVINGATTVIKEHFHTGDAVLGIAVGSASSPDASAHCCQGASRTRSAACR